MAFTYKKSGINYSLMDPFKNACLVAGGNVSNFIEFPNFFLTDINEGLGSLNKLVDDIYDKTGQDYYFQVGWGNAASILNDLAAMGAKPLTIKLFLASGHEDWFKKKNRWKSLIKGFAQAAKYSGASWNGGETQTLIDIVKKDATLLAGSTVGIIQPKTNLLKEETLVSGDRIILLSSSGIHTNGITLIRKIFQEDITARVEAIKSKTIIYSPFLEKLLKSGVKIHYASHITGHGFRKIMRSKRQFSYIIEEIPKPQPIFSKIQQQTGMSLEQMYEDYNMGAGFALFVPQKSVAKILILAKQEFFLALDSGFIEEGSRKIIIKPLGITFKGESLQIR